MIALRPIPLIPFVAALSPHLRAPAHLAPIADAFEASCRGPVAIFATTPPQHGKTELLKHAIVWRLLADPSCRIGYASYSARYAQKRSREIRALYLRAGGRLAKDAASVADWRTGVGQGGLWCGGVDGSWTGESLDLAILDDPIKGRAEAESSVEQAKLIQWFTNDLESRMQMGSSLVAVHTRWTTNDLGAFLLKEPERAYGTIQGIRLPAVSETGDALCPWRFDLAHLNRTRASVGEYVWESLYQGRPFSKGGRVFNDAHFYDADELPANLRLAAGVDLAYSAKTHADWSALVVLGIDDRGGKIYVLDVVREQSKAPAFAQTVKSAIMPHGIGARWYCTGPELGVADFVRELGVDIDAQQTAADKHARAQPVAAAWNAGTILVPKGARWVDDFVGELVSFSGVKDIHDDQVDAFAAAYDQIALPDWVTAMTSARQAGVFGGEGMVPAPKPPGAGEAAPEIPPWLRAPLEWKEKIWGAKPSE